MVDVYQYIMAKQLEGYKFVIGGSMGYHGLNYEERTLTPDKKSGYILYGVTDADDNDKRE